MELKVKKNLIFFLLAFFSIAVFENFLKTKFSENITYIPFFIGIILFNYAQHIFPILLTGNINKISFGLRKIGRMRLILSAGFFIFSLALNYYSAQLHLGFDYGANLPIIDKAVLSWLISLVLIGIASLFLSRPNGNNNTQKDSNPTDKIIFLSILILAAFLRVYRFDFPKLIADENLWLNQASQILLGKLKSPFFFIGDQPSNLPAYIVAFFLAITKNEYFAARLPGILESLSYIFFLFLFLKEAFGKRVALAGSFMAAFSVWDIHNSRIGWNNVSISPFLIMISIYFIYRGFKRSSIFDLFVGGLFLGIAGNLLYIASTSCFAVFGYLAYQTLRDRGKYFFEYLFASLVVILTILFTISPTLVKIKKYPQTISRHQSYLNKNIDRSVKERTGFSYYLNEAKKTLHEFSFDDDKFKPGYFFYPFWGPILENWVSLFFLIGLGYCLGNFFYPPIFLINTLFISMLLVNTLLERGISIWRLMGFSPAIFCYAAIGLTLSIDFVKNLLPKKVIKILFIVTLIPIVYCGAELIKHLVHETSTIYIFH